MGVDGSAGSDQALDWAIAEAIRFPAALELATAWMFPMALGYVFAKTPDEERQEVQRIGDQRRFSRRGSRPSGRREGYSQRSGGGASSGEPEYRSRSSRCRGTRT